MIRGLSPISRCQHFLLLSLAVVAICSCGCSRYEVKEDKEGRTVRVDRWTGDMVLVAGNTMTKLKSPEELEKDEQEAKKRAATLAVPRMMPPIAIPQLGNGVTAHTRMMWRDGVLHFQLSIRPLSKTLRSARDLPYRSSSFTLAFYDDQAFKVKSIDVRLASMAETVDDSGQGMSLDIDDSTICDADEYQRISSWNIFWSGF